MKPTEPTRVAAPVVRLTVTRLDDPPEAPPVMPYMIPAASSKARPEIGPMPVEPIIVEVPVKGLRVRSCDGPPGAKITVP